MSSDALYEAWDLEALAGIPNYQAWILDGFRPYLRGRAVEIGAGTGTFSGCLLAHVERLELVEPALNLTGSLERAFAGNPAVTVIAGSAEDYLAKAAPQSRDCVVMINVLEHLADDRGAIGGLFRLLAPGGHLLVFVPALSWLFGAMDVALGHHRRYHKPALAGIVADAGFRVVEARYFDALGVLPWWLVHTLGARTRFSPGLSRLYDRLAVPFGRLVESVVTPPFGKNVLLVAEKPTR